MPICHDRKLSFCHIPRTGGVSISNALNMKVIDKHYPASWYREKFPDYKIFTIIRPYEDRIKSALGWKVPDHRKHESDTLIGLVEHIKNKGIENIGLMVKPNEYFLDVEVDFTIRFEHLQEDLNTMLTSLGFDTVDLIKCNSFK